MDAKGLLIVICGPSGVGKGTVCKSLLNKNSNINLSISATTREKRKGEVEGKNYFFIKKSKFQNMIANDEFIEYANVYDNFYGTPKKYVLDNLKKGNDILLEIDIQGALQIKDRFPDGIFIFILPPSMEELRKRIIGRGTDSPSVIEKRLRCAYEEIDFIKEYDYFIINDDLDKATNKITAIIEAEKCRINDRCFEEIKKYKEE